MLYYLKQRELIWILFTIYERIDCIFGFGPIVLNQDLCSLLSALIKNNIHKIYIFKKISLSTNQHRSRIYTKRCLANWTHNWPYNLEHEILYVVASDPCRSNANKRQKWCVFCIYEYLSQCRYVFSRYTSTSTRMQCVGCSHRLNFTYFPIELNSV